MKRRELDKRINQIAKVKGLVAVWSEGGNHSKVTVGKVTVSVPRHAEVNELTAQGILRKIEKEA